MKKLDDIYPAGIKNTIIRTKKNPFKDLIDDIGDTADIELVAYVGNGIYD